MKKAYETPKAVKYVFDYTENVVASNGMEGTDPNHPSHNKCFTGNGADMSTRNHKPKCNGTPKGE